MPMKTNFISCKRQCYAEVGMLHSEACVLDYNKKRILFNYNECTRWCSWLRHCAKSRRVAGSILDGVIGIFH